MPRPPKLSLITVTYNAASVLAPTVKSIIGQSYKDFEYLIIDGGSQDGTQDLIQQYTPHLRYWISEPDEGLYDAMNKGLQAARGEYVWFMNAGDLLYDEQTLAKVFEQAEPGADVYYGDALYYEADGHELGLRSQVTPHQLPETLNWQSLRYGMVVCHQSFVVRRSMAPFFDLSHPYSSDIDWEIRCLQQAKKVVHTHAVLCRYLTGGFSKQYLRQSLQDRYRVLQKHYGLVPNLFNHTWITLRGVLFALKQHL